MVLARLALLILAGVLADPTVILSLADAPEPEGYARASFVSTCSRGSFALL